MPRRTVTGSTDDLFTDVAAAGVTVTLSAIPRRWTDETGNRVLAAPDHAVTVTDGSWSASLLPTNEPGIEPATGRYYRLTETASGVPVRVRVFEVPDGVGALDILDLIVDDPGLPGYVRGATGATGATGPAGPQPPLGAAGAGALIALVSTDPTTTNARTPTAHAASHASGGSDPVTPAAIGAETPAGATTKVSTHAAAADPHGDRAWAASQFYPLASGNALDGYINDALTRITDLETRATALEAETRTAVKTADETVTASAALQDDDHLFLSVVANGWYEVAMFIDTEGDPAGDLTMGWTVPAGAALSWTEAGVSAGNTNNIGSIKLGRNDGATSSGIGIIAAGSVVLPRGILRVAGTGGNLQFRWAQTGAAGTTTIKTGSMLKLTRIA